MAPSWPMVICFLFTSLAIQTTASTNIGINYGRVADNLPTPTSVVAHLHSLSITKVKIYDADPEVLRAFSNSNIYITITVTNNEIPSLAADQTKADQWIQQNLLPFLPRNKITSINVGNEVYATNDVTLISNLLRAMQSLYRSLVTVGLDKQVTVSTPHKLDVMGQSYPPSAGTFKQDIAEYMKPLLHFLSETNSPFLVNIYPFFAYASQPEPSNLLYSTFQPNKGLVDPRTNFAYDNMLYAQIDSVYAAMSAMGYNNIGVVVSETGWPSKGDAEEAGASVENAALYNGNLMKRLAMNQGTPMKPSLPVEVYVFALFNENLKPGPSSERNYGLFYPNFEPVCNVGLEVPLQSPSSPALQSPTPPVFLAPSPPALLLPSPSAMSLPLPLPWQSASLKPMAMTLLWLGLLLFCFMQL